MHQRQPRPVQQLDPVPLIQQGFQALRNAAATPAELTIAVLSFHIAAGQLCRQLLAAEPQLPLADHAAIWTEDVSWPGLMELMQRHATLSHEMLRILQQLNRERNDLCHRHPRYQGMEKQVLRYGNAAEQLLYRWQKGEWSSKAAGFSEPEEQRSDWLPLVPDISELDEINLATINRERAREQRQSQDALLENLLLQTFPETEP